MNRPPFVIALLLVGGLLWLLVEASGAGFARPMGPARWVALVFATAAALSPPVRRVVSQGLDRIRHPSPRSRAVASVGIAAAASAYLFLTAVNQDRDFFPKTHDDSSYAIQTQMVARGRLWMPAHPLADFFDSFYLITKPVYASQYFPGTALLNAPAVWLGWPTWVIPLLTAGAVVGLAYRIVTEAVDGVAGAMAAKLVVSLSWFRMLSILLYSHVPMVLFGLLMIWAWLRWRERMRPGWLLLVGVFAGWAAITRPVDALCYAIPVGVAILLRLRREKSMKTATFSLALIVAGAAPFLIVQATLDRGVTGSFFKTPFQVYQERDYPGTGFGFHRYDSSLQPTTAIQQKRDWFAQWAVPFIEKHQPSRIVKTWLTQWLPMLAATALPANWLLALVPVGLLGLIASPRRVLLAVLPLFVLLYVPHTFFLEHYGIIVAPAAALAVALGAKVMEETWPRRREALTSALFLAVAATFLFSLYELNPIATLFTSDPAQRQRLAVNDETFRSTMLRLLHGQLPYAEDLHKPAIMLFRYSPGDSIAQEPVYNLDVAWPDDAQILRAHDLGERNRELFAYYAAKQPARMVYRFDRKTSAITLLGNVVELAKK